MTRAEFEAMALNDIRKGQAVYGWHYADHNDGTLFLATRWANAPDLACGEYFTKDDPRWAEEWKRAMLREQTLHVARRAAEAPAETRGEEPECWCGRDEAMARGDRSGARYDIVCPKHDGLFTAEPAPRSEP